jgi:CGNR zinc finger
MTCCPQRLNSSFCDQADAADLRPAPGAPHGLPGLPLVLYANTRNGSKSWCLRCAGRPEGKACGTIAKVRRYRERQVATGVAGSEFLDGPMSPPPAAYFPFRFTLSPAA